MPFVKLETIIHNVFQIWGHKPMFFFVKKTNRSDLTRLELNLLQRKQAE